MATGVNVFCKISVKEVFIGDTVGRNLGCWGLSWSSFPDERPKEKDVRFVGEGGSPELYTLSDVQKSATCVRRVTPLSSPMALPRILPLCLFCLLQGVVFVNKATNVHAPSCRRRSEVTVENFGMLQTTGAFAVAIDFRGQKSDFESLRSVALGRWWKGVWASTLDAKLNSNFVLI